MRQIRAEIGAVAKADGYVLKPCLGLSVSVSVS